MKDNRKIKYINADGMSVTFGADFSPFVLNDCDGIYQMESNVITSENSMTDGATYQGSNIKMRNIVLTVSAKDDHVKNREKLYRLFKPKSQGTFVYIEDGAEKQIGCYVENIKIDPVKNCRTAVISLLCPEPYFENVADITVEIANWQSLFEFEFETFGAGIEFGTKSQAKSKTIENDCADYTGIEIVISAESTVKNPAIYHSANGSADMEFIKIGTDAKPLTLNGGDRLVITTHTNNKHVYLERDGNLTEVNAYLDMDSEFLQLRNGRNVFSFSADTGVQYMNVAIVFRYKYLGV